MTSKEATEFLVEHGESFTWALAVVSDARFDGTANLLKWDIAYDDEKQFTITPREYAVRDGARE